MNWFILANQKHSVQEVKFVFDSRLKKLLLLNQNALFVLHVVDSAVHEDSSIKIHLFSALLQSRCFFYLITFNTDGKMHKHILGKL